jgi:peptide/nickel transport system ATP-binding protein
MAEPLLVVEKLAKHFAPAAFSRGPTVKAVQDVSFIIPRGQVVGLVGESGSGKTTIGQRAQADRADPGKVAFDGTDIVELPAGEMQKMRRRMQISSRTRLPRSRRA